MPAQPAWLTRCPTRPQGQLPAALSRLHLQYLLLQLLLRWPGLQSTIVGLDCAVKRHHLLLQVLLCWPGLGGEQLGNIHQALQDVPLRKLPGRWTRRWLSLQGRGQRLQRQPDGAHGCLQSPLAQQLLPAGLCSTGRLHLGRKLLCA